jgi:hypothetical protein
MWKRSYLRRWREPGVGSKGVRGQENIRVSDSNVKNKGFGVL